MERPEYQGTYFFTTPKLDPEPEPTMEERMQAAAFAAQLQALCSRYGYTLTDSHEYGVVIGHPKRRMDTLLCAIVDPTEVG